MKVRIPALVIRKLISLVLIKNIWLSSELRIKKTYIFSVEKNSWDLYVLNSKSLSL